MSISTEGVRTTSTARRTAVAVAATVGAAAAVTSLAAPADAAPSYRVWDRVAHCESTNNWDINTGNGFYGGLQFSSSTWAAYGGHKYAHQANHATRTEQIEVARRVLHAQGPGAWPVCGPNAGLTRSSGHATSAKLPALAGASASHTATTSRKAKHRSTADSHAKKSHHSARHAGGSVYKVRSGDTLAQIARSLHVAGGWKALYQANKSTVHNPNVIHVGQVLRLP
ncbi:MAG: transglycosylase family protein [Jatrophihabitans sp.]